MLKHLKKGIAASTEIIKAEYRTSDPGITVSIKAMGEASEEAVDTVCQDNFFKFLVACPTGVEHYSVELKGLVETSHSIGGCKA